MWKTNFIFVFFALFLGTNSQGLRFKVIREWKYINFTWPDVESFNTARAKGLYVPENNIIAGIKFYDGYYYLTLPRMKGGVPATLARIPAGKTSNTSPALEPFPSWAMNNIGDCNNLQNVQNVEIDPKGIIWIIDGGRIETLSPSPVVRCPPKLIVYDIKQSAITTAFTFPEEIASRNGSFLFDLVVDDTDGGYAYITDNSGRDPGIIVYSVKENRSWKIRHPRTMRADPNAVTFRVGNQVISSPINIAGIALGPKIHTVNESVTISDDREVFYSPLSSLHLYSINTSSLRNENFANGEYQEEIKDYGIKASQSSGMIMDNKGVLYYGLLAANSVAKWDIHTSFQSGQKVVAHDEKFLQWPNSFSFDQTGNLTILVNQLSKFSFGKLDLNEANFRLITGFVGGRSYLTDDDYNYVLNDKQNDQMSTISDKDPHFSSDQDPFLAPRIGHSSTSSESTPQMNESSSKTHTEHQMDDQHNHNMVTPKTGDSPSKANSLSFTLLSLILTYLLTCL